MQVSGHRCSKQASRLAEHLKRHAFPLLLLLLPNLAAAGYSCDPGGWITTIGTEVVAKEAPRGADTPIKYYLANLQCVGGEVRPIISTELHMTPTRSPPGPAV